MRSYDRRYSRSTASTTSVSFSDSAVAAAPPSGAVEAAGARRDSAGRAGAPGRGESEPALAAGSAAGDVRPDGSGTEGETTAASDDFRRGAAAGWPDASTASGAEACTKRPIVPTGTASWSARNVRGNPRGGTGNTRTTRFSMVTRRFERPEKGDLDRRWRGGANGIPGSSIILAANAASGICCG